MQHNYIWSVEPLSHPAVVKNCSKCGLQSEFTSTGNFRVNANKSNLDVWLIYQCKKCKTTWNMEIFSRITAKKIDNDLYKMFLENDLELANQFAFDTAIHKKNKSQLNLDSVEYNIQGDSVNIYDISEPVQIQILCKVPANLRLDKVLSQKLNISREVIRQLSEQNLIQAEGIKEISKAKIRTLTTVTISPCQYADNR